MPPPLVEVVPVKFTPLTVAEVPDQHQAYAGVPVVETSLSPVIGTGVFQVIDAERALRLSEMSAPSTMVLNNDWIFKKAGP